MGSDMQAWEALPEHVLATMHWLGGYGPTVHANAREIKGQRIDFDDGGTCKCYLTAADLRETAAHLIVVADWLDQRALSAVAP